MTYRNHKTLQKRGGAGRFERWDRDFGGRVAPLTSNIAGLRRSVWYDRISSFRVF